MRASANTSGPDLSPSAIRPRVNLRNERPPRTERRKTVSSAVPILKGGSSDPAVDLMSRRHPLSSTRALREKAAFADLSPEGPRDAPASRTPASSQRRELLLRLAGLLRSLLHCALRLRLLRFLSHVALLM